jgi:hypothetical protein
MPAEYIQKTEFTYSEQHQATLAAAALEGATGRTWTVRCIRHAWLVELEPILKAPSGADLEEALQTAFDQWLEQYNLYCEDGDIDYRNPMFGSIGTDFGFTVTFQNAKKEFGIMIQERGL